MNPNTTGLWEHFTSDTSVLCPSMERERKREGGEEYRHRVEPGERVSYGIIMNNQYTHTHTQ